MRSISGSDALGGPFQAMSRSVSLSGGRTERSSARNDATPSRITAAPASSDGIGVRPSGVRRRRYAPRRPRTTGESCSRPAVRGSSDEGEGRRDGHGDEHRDHDGDHERDRERRVERVTGQPLEHEHRQQRDHERGQREAERPRRLQRGAEHELRRRGRSRRVAVGALQGGDVGGARGGVGGVCVVASVRSRSRRPMRSTPLVASSTTAATAMTRPAMTTALKVASRR